MWTLIGAHNYYTYSGDLDWLQTIWTNYTKAVAFLEGKVDSSGLMNITGLRDWARLGGGGHNAEGNALLYKVYAPIITPSPSEMMFFRISTLPLRNCSLLIMLHCRP